MMLRTYQDGHGFFTDKRGPRRVAPVSYTHLDVYKRQIQQRRRENSHKVIGNINLLFPITF